MTSRSQDREVRRSGVWTLGVLAAAVAAGASYAVTEHLLIPAAAQAAWKGAGVGLLALYAALRARSADGWLLALVMTFGAVGDVLLDVVGLTVGAVAFLAGHVAAIALYLRNPRRPWTAGRAIWAAAFVAAVVFVAWRLPADRALAPLVALYTTGLALMAAAAWASRFPRRLTGLGALLFVASDLLIFARLGPLAEAVWASVAVWGLYFAGQALICVGVMRTLAESRPGASRAPF